MKAHIKDTINNFMPDDSLMNSFMDIINLPDEQFAATSETLKGQIKDALKTPQIQADFKNILKTTPGFELDPDGASIGLNDMINEIKEDTSLSAEKRDFLVTIIEESRKAFQQIYENPRERVNVTIERIHPMAKLPTYAHPLDAGADVYAVEDVTIQPGETVIVKTGLKMIVPRGYFVAVHPRSGLSAKTNLRIANAPGTIDADYRQEVGIIMTNIGTAPEYIKTGDRIAQFLLEETPMMVFTEGEVIDDTNRGNGFGSTGK